MPDMISPVDPPKQFDSPRLGLALAEVDRLIQAGQARTMFNVDGSGLSAAVLDTGLNTQHVDFAGRIPAQRNFTADNGANPDDATDGNGHGTNVAGIIAAGQDHRGVAPGAQVIPLKVLANANGGSFQAVADALQWVLDHQQTHNIAVVCMSLGDSSNRTNDNAFAQNIVRTRIAALRDKRVAVVIAAGNDYFTHGSQQGMGFPAILRECVSVGAVYDEFEGSFSYSSGAVANSSGPDRLTPFSQRLHTEVHPDCATKIFAPGAPVTSAGIQGPRGESIQHGTSQAAPVVAGAILLMQQLHFRLTGELAPVDRIVELMRLRGVKINDGDDEDDNVVHTGKDFLRLNALGALEAVARRVQRDLLGPEPAAANAAAASI